MIEVAELDGSNRLTLFDSNADDPRAIVVDPFHGYVMIIKNNFDLLVAICCGFLQIHR